jgi:hypothetical protein
MQSLGEKVLEEIGADKKLKIRLAELIISEPDVRLFIINSLFPNVTTKEDVKELRSEMTQLRKEIAQLRDEIHSNFKWTIGVVLTIWGATVIPILLRLIGAI